MLGIGYAAVTDVNLQISSSKIATANTNLRVRFAENIGTNVTSTTIDNSYELYTQANGMYKNIVSTCTAQYADGTALNQSIINSMVGADDKPDIVQPMAATMTVENMYWVGQKATATYVIKNYEKDMNAEIVYSDDTILMDGVVTNNNGYFKVNITSNDTDNIIEARGTSSTPAKTMDITVTVELVKLPKDQDESSATFTIPIVAKPVEVTP